MDNKYFNLIVSVFIFFIYLAGADVHSFWNDEFFTLEITRSEFSKIIPNILYGLETHPPMYPFLAKIFCEIFGYSFFTMRIFACISGTLFFYSVLRFSKRHLEHDNFKILIATLALSPLLLYFTHEFRSYSLFGAFLFFWLDEYDQFISQKEKSTSLLWSIWASCAFYTHTYAVLFIAPVVVFGLKKIIKNNQLKYLLFNTLIIIAICSPWVIVIFMTKLHNVNDTPLGYVKEINLFTLAYTFYSFIVGFSLGPSKEFLHQIRDIKIIFSNYFNHLIPVLIVSILLLRNMIQNRKKIFLLPSHALVFFIFPIGLGYIISNFSGLPFNVRYFLPAFPILFLVLAQVLAKDKVATVLFLSLLAFSYSQYYLNTEYHREDYRGVANYVMKKNIKSYLTPYPRNLRAYGANNIQRLTDEINVSDSPVLFIINRPWLVPGYREIMNNINNTKHQKIESFAGFELYLFNSK